MKKITIFLLLMICGAGLLSLFLYMAEIKESISAFFAGTPAVVESDFPGFPEGAPVNARVEHAYYNMNYNVRTRQPDWVMYRLSRALANQPGLSVVPDSFQADPLLPNVTAEADDFRRSGFMKGPLVPVAHMNWSKTAMSESFLISTVSPRNPSFQQETWVPLDSLIRHWAASSTSLYVVSGPVFKERIRMIGRNRVAVPEYFFRVVLDRQAPEVKALGFVMENAPTTRSLRQLALPVDSVEAFTGLDFFPALPDSLEAAVEGRFEWKDWR